jgi:hypothetical protein
MQGTLALSSGSISNYALGIPNVVGGGINDLVNVKGEFDRCRKPAFLKNRN